MKRLLTNKRFITVVGTIISFLIMLGVFYAISQCISGNINISIGVN